MEARLFSQGNYGGFHNKGDLRSQLQNDFKKDGTYFLTKLYVIPIYSLAFFQMKGIIVGCAIVKEATRDTTEKERGRQGEDWKAVMKLDPKTIWVWQEEPEVKLKDVGIRFLPRPPMTLSAQQVLNIFRLVAQRSR